MLFLILGTSKMTEEIKFWKTELEMERAFTLIYHPRKASQKTRASPLILRHFQKRFSELNVVLHAYKFYIQIRQRQTMLAFPKW